MYVTIQQSANGILKTRMRTEFTKYTTKTLTKIRQESVRPCAKT